MTGSTLGEESETGYLHVIPAAEARGKRVELAVSLGCAGRRAGEEESEEREEGDSATSEHVIPSLNTY